MCSRIILIVVFCLMLVSCSKDPLSSGPDGADLKKRFSTELPAYVGVDSFDVQASENIGSKVEPKFVSRFKATIKLNADTFLESGREGTVVFVAPHLKSGEKREVYGKAVSGYHGGSWQTAFQLDSNPVPGLGTPRDAFGATRVIVKNSEEETLYREQQKREREASAKTNEINMGDRTDDINQSPKKRPLLSNERRSSRDTLRKEQQASNLVGGDRNYLTYRVNHRASGSTPVAIKSVILKQSDTRLHFEIMKNISGVCWNIKGSDAPYLTVNGIKYKILSTDNTTICPNRRSYMRGDFFSLTFEPIPQDAKVFNLIEGEKGASLASGYWNFINVMLK
jgi:hypothetical protein